MDEATSRAQPPRRMAATPASTVRTRSSSSRSSRPGDEGPGIGRARWAGVGLVIAALLGAIILAIISPGTDAPAGPPDTDGSPGIASPPPSVVVQTPVARPQITSPREGWVIGEWYVDVKADVPEEPLPKRLLEIVVYRNGEAVTRQARPQTPGTVEILDVQLLEGKNTLTVALVGPGDGEGPMSDPVTVTQDRLAPDLTITSPEANSVTTEAAITVAGESEAGATVTVHNALNGWDQEVGVGANGTFEVNVRLDIGKNRITVRSTDQARQEHEDNVVVQRKDGRPVIDLQVPKSIARSDLPKQINIVVIAKDTDGEPVENATVSFAIGAPGWSAQDFVDHTNADGRAVWKVDLAPGVSEGQATVTVDVSAPDGERRKRSATIDIR